MDKALRDAVETVLPAMLRERANRAGKHFDHERDDKIIAALEAVKEMLVNPAAATGQEHKS